MLILVGCEESQAVCKAFRAQGHEAFSCDLKPCSGGHPEWHLQMDIFEAIQLKKWDMLIAFPDCTYLTISAEWAYKEGPYHQKVKPETLTGLLRKQAREQAIQFVERLWNCGIERIALENPVGVLSSRFMKPSQIIQPWYFGDDASKKTCLWLKNLPLLKDTNRLPGDHLTRRANQTANGQNRLSPGPQRAELRSKTYNGIAQAIAAQWC